MNESLQKTLALPNDVKSYFYIGHGADVCDPDSNQVVTHTVPDNCIYITIEQCGNTAYYKDERNAFLHSAIREDSALLKYPYLNLTKRRLAELLFVNEDIITVRLPGQTYAVSNFLPLAYWYRLDYPKLRYSGLCEKADLELHPEIVAKEAHWLPFLPGATYPYINKEQVIGKFAASSYPTMERVRHALRDRPANYYPVDIDDGKRYFHNIAEDIQKEYGFFNGISREDGPDAFFSNTYLMEKFPGIHYNVICRDLTCADHSRSFIATERRRSNSITQIRASRGLLNDSEFIWSVLDKIDRVETDEVKRSINQYTRAWKLANPRPPRLRPFGGW